MASDSPWPRFQKYFLRYADLSFLIDISRMRFADDFLEKMRPRFEKAFAVFHTLHHAVANNSAIGITLADRAVDEKFYRKK